MSASDKYSNMSRGCSVNDVERKYLTTRKDGNKEVYFGGSDGFHYGLLYIGTSKK